MLLLSWQVVEAADIKVMTYNIHAGVPPSSTSPNLLGIAAVINAASPDLVALQEVDKNTTRSGGVDQAAYLATATGMNYYFAKALNFQGGEYGIAILSKYPIIETFRYELPMVDGVSGERRVLAIVKVLINGQTTWFGNTHFDIVEVHKQVQAAKAVEIAQGITGPFILAGDFNVRPTTQPMVTLREAFNLPCINCQYTASSTNPTHAIDHVIYNDQVLQNRFVSKYEVINQPTASDHLPVMATFSDRSPEVLSWQFATPSTNGREASIDATFKEVGLNTSTLVRGNGLRTQNDGGANMGLANGFVSGTGIPSSTALADTAIAVANDMYFGFDVSVKEGYELTLNHIKYKVRISGGGAKTWYWKYSVDGTAFHKIAEPEILTAATVDAGVWQPEVSLANINALKNIAHGTTVKFRLYVSGSNTTSGTTALGRSATGTSDDPILMLGGTIENVATPTKILSWNFFSPATAGNETSLTSSFANAGLNTATLSRGAGLRTVTNAGADIAIDRGFSAGATVSSSANLADTTIAKTNNMYFAFNLNVKSGYRAWLRKIAYKVRISAGGSKTWYWTYSLNGTTFHKITDPVTLTAATAGEGVLMPEVSLKDIQVLQNLESKTIHFRLYVSGSNASTGTTAIARSSNATDDALQIFGVVEDLGTNLDVLPVTLLDFKAQRQNEGVKLNWETASEVNNDYFEILRYTDNKKSAVALTTIKGRNQAANYTYHDKSADFGNNYYQLKQVDFNGDVTLSKVVSVNNQLSKNDLKVYIKENQIRLEFLSPLSTTANVALFNISGQKQLNQNINLLEGVNSISIAQPSVKGIYIISLTIQGKNTAQKINIP
ncbi:endonuclease/exonuclease/phosphatase family protein [Pedobacter xixiisoli]|nr:endonuclease/exonuclease/phosphatase family protein [Pedobacter xixiisoli]